MSTSRVSRLVILCLIAAGCTQSTGESPAGGQLVISQDFVFARTVYMDDALTATDRMPEQLMESVEPIDDKTFVIHWKQPYPRANELTQRQLEPLPAHILGSVYAAGDSDAF